MKRNNLSEMYYFFNHEDDVYEVMSNIVEAFILKMKRLDDIRHIIHWI